MKILLFFTKDKSFHNDLLNANFIFRLVRTYKQGIDEMDVVIVKILYDLFDNKNLYEVLFKNNVLLMGDETGLVNLTQLMNTYARILGMTIFSTKLLFYNIADHLQYQKKISTIEFVFRQNLTLGQELTINEFYSNIIKPLNLKDIEGITVFKALDVNKRQKIRVEDFVIVIDSYRDDNSFYAKKISEISEKISKDGNV